MEVPVLVLVHSPFVGPLTWFAVAEQLRTQGFPAVAPDLRAAFAGPAPYRPVLAELVAEHVCEVEGELVLAGHSGAGPLLPELAERLGGRVRALVYVDCGLPQPGRAELDTLPDDIVSQLRGMVRAGRLPPWHRWFPPQVLAEMAPGEALRDAFTGEVPEVPFDYLAEPAPTRSWPGPAAYVLLSAVYQRQAAIARALGYPVAEYDSHHLAMLTAPTEVAAALVSAVDALE
ncbi:alpha/beta fold hydrolase [Nocardia sp. NPDC050712]|uniref:alpha/beta fold hydrolase n=1 Tax=Nocardia sp. NPDC050712 TaxID=3155518 RepID=UPI0033DAD6E9